MTPQQDGTMDFGPKKDKMEATFWTMEMKDFFPNIVIKIEKMMMVKPDSINDDLFLPCHAFKVPIFTC